MIFKLNWALTKLKLNLVCNSLVLISEIFIFQKLVPPISGNYRGGEGAGGTLSTESVQRGGGPGHHIDDDTISFTIRLY